MSSFLNAATVLSAYGADELGLGPADGLIEIDLRGNMLTGSLSASLARLPIVVRPFCICWSHSSLSVSAAGTVCCCSLLLHFVAALCCCSLLLLPEVLWASDDIMYQSPASRPTAKPFDSHRSIHETSSYAAHCISPFVPHLFVGACYRVWMWATICSPAASMHCWIIAGISSASRRMAICCLGHFQQIWPHWASWFVFKLPVFLCHY